MKLPGNVSNVVNVNSERPMEEAWKRIPEFPDYEVSDQGRIFNIRRDRFMRTNINNWGHIKVNLIDPRTHEQKTRSVAQLVAEAFVKPRDALSDRIILKDGDRTNVTAQNLAWRPRWFVHKYTGQFRREQPLYMYNLPILNTKTGVRYESIIACGIREGALFEDVWRSTYSHNPIYPHHAVYEVLDRT